MAEHQSAIAVLATDLDLAGTASTIPGTPDRCTNGRADELGRCLHSSAGLIDAKGTVQGGPGLLVLMEVGVDVAEGAIELRFESSCSELIERRQQLVDTRTSRQQLSHSGGLLLRKTPRCDRPR